MNRTRSTTTDRRRQGGQALAEMGLVVLLFVLLTCGIVEFGRMLMILNVITHAARDGARVASTIPSATWGAQVGSITTGVQSQIATVSPESFGVATSCAAVGSGESFSRAS
jgi:Flp pilus assembly protein TadG